MIEDVGRVAQTSGDKALVLVERSSKCLMCGLQQAERLGAGGKPAIEALNNAGANTGDMAKYR